MIEKETFFMSYKWVNQKFFTSTNSTFFSLFHKKQNAIFLFSLLCFFLHSHEEKIKKAVKLLICAVLIMLKNNVNNCDKKTKGLIHIIDNESLLLN